MAWVRTNEYLREWYKKNQERVVKLNRINRNKPKIKAWLKKYDHEYYEAHKEEIKAKRIAYKLLHPEKLKARQKVRDAVKAGRIKKLPCESCGETKSEAHHVDYFRPLDVRWLCRPHHREQERMSFTSRN